MRTRIRVRPRTTRTAFLAAAGLSVGAFVVIACSSDGDRADFVEDTSVDAQSEASLPETSTQASPDASDVEQPIVDASIAFDAAPDPVVCATEPCAVQLVGGTTYFCARMSDETVRCWGTDYRGSLGRTDVDASADAAAPPAPVQGLEGVTQLSARVSVCATVRVQPSDGGEDAGDAGDSGTSAFGEDAGDGGIVKCWGSNDISQLGVRTPAAGDTLTHAVPTTVPLTEPAVRVDTNDSYTCAVLASGNLACWGMGSYGVLGRTGTSSLYSLPAVATRVGNVGAEGTKTTTGMALTEDGKVVTWAALLGRETSVLPTDPAFKPLPIPTLGKVHDVAAEVSSYYGSGTVPYGHACAIVQGTIYCWGTLNTFGAMGTGIANPEPFPVPVTMPEADGGYPKQVAVSTRNTCVRMSDGTVQCAGLDHRGQLGRGVVPDGGLTVDGGVVSPTFVAATAVTGDVVDVALGGDTACALRRDGTVECWGSNEYGQLGQGTKDKDPHPTPLRIQF